MACRVPYIENRYRSQYPLLADRLTNKYFEIQDDIRAFGEFREYGDTFLFSKKGTKKYQKQLDFIEQLTAKYKGKKPIIYPKYTQFGYNIKAVIDVTAIEDVEHRKLQAELGYSNLSGNIKEAFEEEKKLQEGLQWLREVMPDVQPELVEGLIDGIADGKYDILQDLIALSKDYATKATVREEAFHRAFSMIPQSEREKLLDEASKKYGISRGESKVTARYSQAQEKENKQFQKLTAEEKARTIEQVTKEHRSITALKDLAAKLAHRIGGTIQFENNVNSDNKGWNQGRNSMINLAHATPDTPFHEILAHPIIRAIKNRTNFKNLDNFIKAGPYNYGTEEKPKFQYLLGFIDDKFLQEKVKYLFDKKYDEEYNEEYYIKEFTSEKEAIDFAKKLKNELLKSNNLYQSLLKELETSETGRKVFEQVKRDYVYKDGVAFDTTEIKDGEPTSTKEYSEIIKYAKEQGFYNEDPFSIGDFTQEKTFTINGKTYKTTIYKDGSSGISFLPKYTLEEQQEEAVVQIIGLYSAQKLDKLKDKTLIQLIKELLKEMSDFVKLIFKKEINITKDLDNISELTDTELNKLLKNGEITKKC